MVLLTAENICKSYGTRTIFDGISFSIHEGDKIGLIGVNGTGKTTLLRILCGEATPDTGEVVTVNGMRMSYLSQIPQFAGGTTVLQQAFQGENPKLTLVRDYEEAMTALAQTPEDVTLIEKTAHLTEAMDKAEAWSLESEAKNILMRLGISDFSQKVETLSGGQRKRIALAAALIAPVDLLILDEPTNHIDHETVEWLENHLEKYSKALIMVTHDRYFLDRVANRTLELAGGKIFSYQTNYSGFLEMKAEREELEAAGERKRQNVLRTELQWVRRGAKARTTKQKARLQRFDEISNQKAPEEKQNVALSSVSSRLGKKTIELSHISKAYGEKHLIDDFSYIILRDDRIGITGENGAGKTTLLKIITGTLLPDQGIVTRGDTVKIGIFAQENGDMDESMSLLDYIREEGEYIETGEGRVSASQMLERFLFAVDMQRGPISMLSGGEKRRLYLARVLMGAPNILFLDEPTNDLDIETLMILEDYLDGFGGAVISVSHDRYFLDRTCGRMFAFLGNGVIKQYEGGYSDFKEAYARETPREEEQKPKKGEQGRERVATPILKMSYQDSREYETIGKEIEDLEKKLEMLLADMEGCTSDYTRLQELSVKKEALEATLEERMERWMVLMELAEEIEENRKNGDK